MSSTRVAKPSEDLSRLARTELERVYAARGSGRFAAGQGERGRTGSLRFEEGDHTAAAQGEGLGVVLR